MSCGPHDTCDPRTVTTLATWADVGSRLRDTRVGADLTQVDLASRTGLDRTALVKIEAGERKVSALELFALAEALEVPLEHLLTASPPPVVARRTTGVDEHPGAAERAAFRLDVALEQHARDAHQLVDLGVLLPQPRADVGLPSDRDGARARARELREKLDLGTGPLPAMSDVAEQVGLFLLGVDVDADGACLDVDDWGVAVVGGREPGRRRMTAAHEIGHFVTGDTYASDPSVSLMSDERERVIDAFAAELLLPQAVVIAELEARTSDEERRSALVRVAATWRTSWSVAVLTAHRLDALDRAQRDRLLARAPDRVELLGLAGVEPRQDVSPGETGAGWRRAVVTAVRRVLITPDRGAQLLHGAVTPEELTRA